MKKEILLVLMALLLVGSLVAIACPAPVEPVGVEPVIRLLGTVAFSGAAAGIGPGYDRAMRLAIDEINEAGIEGFSHIEYRVIDTETSPAAFRAKLLREIKMWQPHIAGGAALETTIRVACELAPIHSLPSFVGGHLSVSKYLPPGEVPSTPWVVYYGFASYFAGWSAGQFFHEKGAERVAFIAGDYDWGFSNSKGLKSYWEQHGRPFEIYPVIYTPLGKTDYSTEVGIIKAAQPCAIFIPFTGAGWFALPTQLRDADARPPIVLMGVTYSNLGGAIATGEWGAEGIFTLAAHDPGSEEWAAFVRRWKDAFGEDTYPDTYANNYYEMIYWIREVFEKAGTTDPYVIIETMQKTSFRKVNIGYMGPVGPDGENLGAKGTIIQFLPGAGDLHPIFGLHSVLVEVFEPPLIATDELRERMKVMEKLLSGGYYPRG